MREILFRGKTINNGKWIEGYLFENWGDAYICLGTENGNIMKEKVNEVTVGQYTGLRQERNGKIFEGDIVKSYAPREIPCLSQILESDIPSFAWRFCLAIIVFRLSAFVTAVFLVAISRCKLFATHFAIHILPPILTTFLPLFSA